MYLWSCANLGRTSDIVIAKKGKGKSHTHRSRVGGRNDSILGSQPAGDSMHSHEPGGGLPPPPTRPTTTHMHSHKPGGRPSLLPARPTVTFPAVGCHRPQASTNLYWL